MVLMGHRGTKKCHDTVASELVDRPFIFVNFIHQDTKTSIHDLVDFLGVEILSDRRIVGHIGKKHCHQLPLPLDGTASGKDLISKEFRGVGLGFGVV
jgi:hypothetical protein